MPRKSVLGFVLGICLAALIMFLPLEGMPLAGRKCLALSLLTVCWWAMGVMHPGYSSLFLLCGYTLWGVAPASEVFGLWATPLIYLVIGGYLIASAVRHSGLGKRIALMYALRYIEGYRSIIVGAYVLGFLLSFLIPHPWPRNFLIMSVMAMITRGANMPKEDAANVGLAVFGSSAATSTILLTGDSMLNVVTVGMAGADVGWLGWIGHMGVPGVAASVLMLLIQLSMYRPKAAFRLDKEEIGRTLAGMGKMTGEEARCLVWIVIAVAGWVTDTIHGIHPGWVALLCAVGMTLPRLGGVLNASSWNDVSLPTLFFLTASLGIGKIGDISGMNAWLAQALLPARAPADPFLFAGFVSIIAMALHMFLGSVIAVLGIVMPSIIMFGNTVGMPPLASALIVYMAIVVHFILPFHQMSLLVGLGEKQGGYTDRDVMRLGLRMTVVVFVVTMLVQVPWWKLIGLL